MALRPVLDLDLLRTLVFIAEEASFTKAAERVGRTQSAVTLQVQKIEALVGQPLLVRSKGGPVELTPQGRALVDKARAMLKLNDEAFHAMGSRDLTTTVRLAACSTYMPFFLSPTLDALRLSHPEVLVEVTEGYSCQLAPRIKDDAFDLAVCEGGLEPRGWPATEVWRGPLKWITSIEHSTHLRNPLPLSLSPSDCPWRPAWKDDCHWRSAPLRTLEGAARPYRVVTATTSMEALYGSVLAGEAVTVSMGAGLPEGLRVVRDDEGLPPLPDDSVVLIKARNAAQPLTDIVAETILSTFSLNGRAMGRI
jgi:DNA-binding transcriptional LysR family regulator